MPQFTVRLAYYEHHGVDVRIDAPTHEEAVRIARERHDDGDPDVAESFRSTGYSTPTFVEEIWSGAETFPVPEDESEARAFAWSRGEEPPEVPPAG